MQFDAFLGTGRTPELAPQVNCGAFSYKIPLGYEPSEETYDAAREQVLEGYLNNLGARLRLDASDLYEHLELVEKDYGAFEHISKFSVYWAALVLLDTFRDDIPNDGSACPNAGDKISDRLMNVGATIFKSSAEGSCATHPAEFGIKTKTFGCAGLPTAINVTVAGAAAYSAPVAFATDPDGTSGFLPGEKSGPIVNVCPQFLEAMTIVADAYLGQGITLYSLYIDGRAESPDYATQGTDSARLALGAILRVAGTILHELLHIEFWNIWSSTLGFGEHCDYKCCQSSLSLKWMCRVASQLGLYSADIFGLDVGLVGWPFEDQSGCDLGNFQGGCTMNNPGTPAGSEDWFKVNFASRQQPPSGVTRVNSWFRPQGCR